MGILDISHDQAYNLASDALDIIENDTNTLLDLRFHTEFTTDLGDCLSLKTMVDGLNLTAEVSSCSGEDLSDKNYLVTFSDLHCNVRLRNEVSLIQAELGPEQCKTKYAKFDDGNVTMIAIRNTVHIFHGTFIGDLIVGVREDTSTLGKPIPIGRNYKIEDTMLAKIFDDYSDPAEPLPPCETAKNGVSCYGKFTGSIQKWSDKTFQEIYQGGAFELGKPIYFSAQPALRINALKFYIQSCEFGVKEKSFTFLENNGCLFKPLKAASYDEFVTPTGQMQRFQFNAFMFSGPPFTGLELSCRIKICIQMGDFNECPTLQPDECPEDFENGKK